MKISGQKDTDRMPVFRRFFLYVFAVLAVSSPAVARSGFDFKAVVSVGRDAAGRPCLARRTFGDPLAESRGARAYDLSCGRSLGIGRIYVFADSETNLAAWRVAAYSLCVGQKEQDWSVLGMRRRESKYCSGETSGVDLSDSGRPAMVLLAASAGKTAIAGDAILAATPALERAIHIFAGLEKEPDVAAPAGPRSALLESLEASLGQELSAGGFAEFSTLRRIAFENNSVWMFSAAELQFSDAIRMHASLWPQDYVGRADLQSERGLNLSNQRRFAEAEQALIDAKANADRSNDGFIKAKIIAYQALAALNSGNTEEMFRLSAQAQALLDAWRKSKTPDDARDQTSGLLPPNLRAAVLDAEISRARGVAYSRMGKPDLARAEFSRGAQFAGQLDPKSAGWLQAGIAQDTASLELASGRLSVAQRVLGDALSNYVKIASRTRVEANMLMDLGDVEMALGHQELAFDRFQKAFTIYREQPENRGVNASRGQPYLRALTDKYKTSGAQSDAEALFSAYETIASPAVAQTAAATGARLMAGPGGSAIRAWQDSDRTLRRAMTRLSALPVDGPVQQREQAEADVARNQNQLLKLQSIMDRQFPNYGVVTLQSVALSELVKAIGSDERVIRLAIGRDGGVGLMIDQKGVKAFRVKLSESDVVGLVNRVKSSVRNPAVDFDRAASIGLFNGLFGEVKDSLLSDAAPKRLIVEASGAMSSLPLGVLLTGERDAHGEAWLVKRRSLISVASLRAFVSTRGAGVSKGKTEFVGLGDFLPLNASPETAGAMAQLLVKTRHLPQSCLVRIQDALAKLPRLEGTATEIARVAEVTKSGTENVFLRERFTDRQVLANPVLSDAKVIMFSTHGVFASEYGDARECMPEAALLTSSTPDAAGVFLDTAQVLDLKLDADLIVLSACDTGNPEPIAQGETGLPSGGDALSGLARSFFYAGARSVLVSHWVLPDSDTVAVMSEFFKHLKSGMAPPEALQAAQLAQIAAGNDDPLQWAAFALVGAPPPL